MFPLLCSLILDLLQRKLILSSSFSNQMCVAALFLISYLNPVTSNTVVYGTVLLWGSTHCLILSFSPLLSSKQHTDALSNTVEKLAGCTEQTHCFHSLLSPPRLLQRIFESPEWPWINKARNVFFSWLDCCKLKKTVNFLLTSGKSQWKFLCWIKFVSDANQLVHQYEHKKKREVTYFVFLQCAELLIDIMLKSLNC